MTQKSFIKICFHHDELKLGPTSAHHGPNMGPADGRTGDEMPAAANAPKKGWTWPLVPLWRASPSTRNHQQGAAARSSSSRRTLAPSQSAPSASSATDVPSSATGVSASAAALVLESTLATWKLDGVVNFALVVLLLICKRISEWRPWPYRANTLLKSMETPMLSWLRARGRTQKLT